jgi:hypothetical protein
MAIATDPPVSEQQRKAMFAAASGHSDLGIPKKVGEEFVGKVADQGGPFLAGVRTFLRGLMQWVAEEENESEHGEGGDGRTISTSDKADAAPPAKPDALGANDMAFDRSLRTKDADGRLHLETSNISKAAVNPYPGREIPNWENLGLDEDRIYMLLRHPDELSKPETIKSFNNLQILSEHVPVSTDTADSHRADLTIGSLGTDAAWDPPYLKNSLVFWAKPAIEAIENDEMKELSCAYRYDADMTPGTYQGQPYDGVMRNLEGNHLALVKKGRAGPDVVVGDSAEGLEGRTNGKIEERAMAKLTPAVLAGFKKVLGGVKLKNGKMLAQDADIDEILPLIETILATPEDEPSVDNGMEANSAIPMAATMDETDEEKEARIRADCRAADAVRRLGRDETDEERKKREDDDKAADSAAKAARDAAKPAKDAKKAKDAEEDDDDDDKKKATDSNGFRNVAGDSAMTPAQVKQTVSAAVTAALARAARTQSEIREAERAVRPYVGELAIACDSAEAVYRTALSAMGVKVEGVHPSAFATILSLQEKPSATRQRETRSVAMDAAAASSYAERFPGADKIRVL